MKLVTAIASVALGYALIGTVQAEPINGTLKKIQETGIITLGIREP